MAVTKTRDRQNPYSKANVISRTFFWWLRGIFVKKFSKALQQDDLYDVLPVDEAGLLGRRLETNWHLELSRAAHGRTQPSLWRALVRTFWWQHLCVMPLMCLLSLILRPLQPLLLGGFVSYFRSSSDMPVEEAYMYAGCLCASFVATVILQHQAAVKNRLLGMRMRVALVGLIYRKVTRLSKGSLVEATSGQIVNLITNDVSRFDVFTLFAATLFLLPPEMFLIVYLLWEYIGVTAFVVLGTSVLLALPGQVWMCSMTAKWRLRVAACTDERVRRMGEFISGMRVIKMYAWEESLSQLVKQSRRNELLSIGKMFRTWTGLTCYVFLSTNVTLFVALSTYVCFGNTLTADTVYLTVGLLNMLSRLMSNYLPRGGNVIMEAAVSVKRIQDFLVLDEAVGNDEETTRSVKEVWRDTSSVAAAGEEGGVVTLVDVTARWGDGGDTLCDISVELKSGEMLVVTGEVGSGKSSLLHVIMREIPVTSGRAVIGGTLSYAAQEPWIFNGSVASNILFGQEYNAKRYDDVVRVCALRRDFDAFPYGDRTLVGERGITLSGGQKARISLARAVYREADIYLLDDPFSAVDVQVRQHIWDACVMDFLGGKTRILVTHQLHLLQQVENILVLSHGHIEGRGSYRTLVDTHASFEQLIKSLDQEENSEDAVIAVSTLDRHPEVVAAGKQEIITINNNTNNTPDKVMDERGNVATAESKTVGNVSWAIYWQYIRAGNHLCYLTAVAVTFVISQAAFKAIDYWIAYWTNEQEVTAGLATDTNSTATAFSLDNLSATSSPLIYAGLLVAIGVAIALYNFLFYAMCGKSSRRLHDAMLRHVMRAKMAFFEGNPAGRILNRFSNDLGTMDEVLPKNLSEVLLLLLPLTGALVLVAISTPWSAVLLIVVIPMLYAEYKVYTATSQDVKRLIGIAQSPIISHLGETLNGLTTIRASQALETASQHFSQYQNAHTAACYVSANIAEACGLYLDMVMAGFAILVVFSFLTVQQDTTGSQVGLAVHQCMWILGLIPWLMMQFVELTDRMVSVERVIEYTHIEMENQSGTAPPADWPRRGRLQFKGVSVSYGEHEVLREVDFSVESQEKVGIVGRTGAGKSSLLAALFRLVSHGGTILIDGLDTRQLRLDDLRRAMSIIPQDPVLFSATIRHNLDPFDQYTDAELWDALEEVELKQAIPSLCFNIEEMGGNLSVGQRQLVCLARAILRHNKIIVMDEATANVDQHTDALIQRTIRRRFFDCTILTIAHRLNTIIDSDQVILMDHGCILEHDHPYCLLQNPCTSLFQEMVQDTGTAMAQQLTLAAQQTYNTKIRLPSYTSIIKDTLATFKTEEEKKEDVDDVKVIFSISEAEMNFKNDEISEKTE